MANSNFLLRKIHRDFGYFFVGLIISFALSGIAQNHRRSFEPESYVYSSIEVQTNFNTLPKDTITKELISSILSAKNLNSKVRAIRPEDGGKKLRIFFEEGVFDIDLIDGKGKIEVLKTRPIIGQMAVLHKSTQSFWIWYSDIFALGLVTIAVTGLFMFKGEGGFKSRGYKLAIAGLVIPLVIVLFFL